MKIIFTNTFFKSLKKLANSQLWYNKIFDFLRYDLPQGIHKLIKWFPVIWKDRDWDDYYIFSILEFKLRNQSKNIKENGNHVDAWYDARNMKICADIINKIKSAYYEEEHFDYQELGEGEGEDWFTTINENYDDYFSKNKLMLKKVIQYLEDNKAHYTLENPSKDRTLLAMTLGRLKHKKAIKLLFSIMNNHIERWWD